jgi:hypothetical protein
MPLASALTPPICGADANGFGLAGKGEFNGKVPEKLLCVKTLGLKPFGAGCGIMAFPPWEVVNGV